MLKRAAILLSSGLIGASLVAGAPAQANGRPARYIVVLNPGSTDPGAVAAEHANEHSLVVSHIYRYALRGYAATVPAARLDDLRADPRVAYISEDGLVEASHHRPGHGSGGEPAPPPPPPAQSVPTGINRIDGEASRAVSGDGAGVTNVDVAVIDTGIDVDHPDLSVYTAGGKDCTGAGTFDDANGHGTHVAGTIGALDNTSGVVGVAPGARLWPVRVLNSRGSGQWSWIICGVDWVTQNSASIEVANMSLGGSGSEPADPDFDCVTTNALHDAVCRSVTAGVTYTVAAGNESADAATRVPASFNEVITVSALADFDGVPGGAGSPTCRSDLDDTFADFSNYGADVDIIAPGVCINSTYPGGTYKSISGTSMAAPHVAGAAALYKATNASASPAAVQSALQSLGTADWSTSTDRDTTNEPLLNVAAL